MKLKKLQKAAAKEALEKLSGARKPTEDDLHQAVLECVRGSSRFKIEGKTVRLAA